MLQEGDLIKIIRSDELDDLGMNDFVGLGGVIVTDLTDNNRRSKGYIVRIDKGVPEHVKDGDDTWYIPEESTKQLKL